MISLTSTDRNFNRTQHALILAWIPIAVKPTANSPKSDQLDRIAGHLSGFDPLAARPGPVTLVSILPYVSGYQVALLKGEAVSTSMVFPGNPLRVGFGCPAAQLIDWIHDEGIGHHWMAGYGHVGEEIREWARIVGPKVRLVRLN